jgi:threonine aldolase
LETMTGRLSEDHDRACRLAEGLSASRGVLLEPPVPATNMVFLKLKDDLKLSGVEVRDRLKDMGILVGLIGDRRFRLVTHYWIGDQDIAKTINSFATALKS